MRRQLLGIGLIAVIVTAVALGVPLAVLYSEHRQSVMSTRESAAVEVAARELAVAVGAEMPATIRQTLALRTTDDRAYVVLGRDRSAIAGGATWAGLDATQQRAAGQALRGRRVTAGADGLLPSGPLISAAPIVDGEESVAAVVLVSSTDAVRRSIQRRWMLLAIGGLGALLLYMTVAIPATRWLMRPIDRLTVAALGDGDRPRVRVDTATGPPELRRLGEAFNLMTTSVEQSIEAQRGFAADASHQLRNPLTALRLRVENLEPYLDGNGRATLNGAFTELGRMEEIVGQLLDLARADDASSAELVDVDVAAVVRARADLWRARSTGRVIAVAVHGDQPARAVARRASVDHCVDVLLENALKFSPAASPVDVLVRATGPTVDVEVTDHGPGMTALDMERACERFWRGSAAHGTAGSGLGLSIAQRLLANDGGTLSFQSPTGHGCRAILRLPRFAPR